eukprot:jgi/Psemu1/30694/gm1.30694_g
MAKETKESADKKGNEIRSDEESINPKPRKTRRKFNKKKKKHRDYGGESTKFTGLTEEIKNDTFTYYGGNQAKQWLKSRQAFITYAGGKYGQNAMASLLNGRHIIVTLLRRLIIVVGKVTDCNQSFDSTVEPSVDRGDIDP